MLITCTSRLHQYKFILKTKQKCPQVKAQVLCGTVHCSWGVHHSEPVRRSADQGEQRVWWDQGHGPQPWPVALPSAAWREGQGHTDEHVVSRPGLHGYTSLCSSLILVLLPSSFKLSPWYNCTSWLGVKHQLTYLLIQVYALTCSNPWWGLVWGREGGMGTADVGRNVLKCEADMSGTNTGALAQSHGYVLRAQRDQSFFFKPGVGQIIALHDLPTARNCLCFYIQPSWFIQLHFFPVLFTRKVSGV